MSILFGFGSKPTRAIPPAQVFVRSDGRAIRVADERPCVVCGDTFRPRIERSTGTRGRFCSALCNNVDRQARERATTRILLLDAIEDRGGQTCETLSKSRAISEQTGMRELRSMLADGLVEHAPRVTKSGARALGDGWWLVGKSRVVVAPDKSRVGCDAFNGPNRARHEADVLDAIGDGHVTIKAIAETIGASVSYVHTTLTRLVAQGRLRRREVIYGAGRRHLYALAHAEAAE